MATRKKTKNENLDPFEFMGTLFPPFAPNPTQIKHGSHDDFYLKLSVPFEIDPTSKLHQELEKYLRSLFNWLAWTIYNYQVNPNIINLLSIATNNQIISDKLRRSPPQYDDEEEEDFL